MGTNYYDSILFQTAEEDLGLSLIESNEPQLFVTPTTTYAQYKIAVGLAYDSSPPLEKKLIDYHMSALTEVVSSGVTTDPDYWSASSVNGTHIINSGLTSSRVGIGTTIPTHTLTVSGTVSASSSLYAGVTDVTNLKIGGTQGSDGQVLTSTGSGVAWEDSAGGDTNVYWSASSIDGSYIINSGLTTSRVGIGTMNPPYTLTVSGDVGVNEYIYHNGDVNTYIRLQDDHLNLVAGGKSMIRLDMGATQDKVEINNTNADIDFRVMNDNGDTILSTDAENTRVGVNNIIPNHALSVSGSVSASSVVYGTTLEGTINGGTF